MAELAHQVSVAVGPYNESIEWYPLLDMFPQVPYSKHLGMAIIMTLVLILAITGNLGAIAIFLGSPKLCTPSNMLIVNLAVADLMMAVTSFPLLIRSSFKGRWMFSQAVCKFYGASASMFGLMSINTLVFISLDRLIVISSPQQFVRIKYRHSLYCIVAVWIYSATWAVMPLLGWNRYILEGYGTTCSIDYFTREEPHSHFLVVMFLADFVFPCIIIFVSYTVIFLEVRKHVATTADIMGPEEAAGKDKKPKWSRTEYKIARTCLTVFILYCLTWTPYAIVVLMGQYGDPYRVTPAISMLPAVFAKLSTIYNPIIYALSHPRFRDRMRELFARLNGQDSLRGVRGTRLQSASTENSRAKSSTSENGKEKITYEGLEYKKVGLPEDEEVKPLRNATSPI